MKIVVDSNRIIASLIKKGTTRSLLLNKKFDFVAPSYIFTEINKYKKHIISKTRINEEEFEFLLSVIFENIKIIPYSDYGPLLDKLKKEITDIKDVPYLAVTIFTKAKGIWTHDVGFKEQNKIKVFTNIDLLKLL